MKWGNRLAIGDADLYLIEGSARSRMGTVRDEEDVLRALGEGIRHTMQHADSEPHQREIVLCYKCIYVNTFTVFVIKLDDPPVIVFRYEMYHIWESTIKGSLLSSNDFLILSKDGEQALSLARHGSGRQKAFTEEGKVASTRLRCL